VDVGVVAIFRGESQYLAEWLAYHVLVGVQHFWMFTNDCDATADAASTAVLQPFVDAGVVTLRRDFQCASAFQMAAYNTGLDHIRATNAAQWWAVVMCRACPLLHPSLSPLRRISCPPLPSHARTRALSHVRSVVRTHSHSRSRSLCRALTRVQWPCQPVATPPLDFSPPLPPSDTCCIHLPSILFAWPPSTGVPTVCAVMRCDVHRRVGFFDLDEFFVIDNDTLSVSQLLHAYDAEPVAAVAFNRLVSVCHRCVTAPSPPLTVCRCLTPPPLPALRSSSVPADTSLLPAARLFRRTRDT
jgi:hypothetical protein